jgi:hypothetical protein
MSQMPDLARSDRNEVVAHVEERIDDPILTGVPFHETLDELVRIAESATPCGMIASILLLSDDGLHLLHGAGPSLPKRITRPSISARRSGRAARPPSTTRPSPFTDIATNPPSVAEAG